MKLEDQVCSLELAKRLKELGVKQGEAIKENQRLSNHQPIFSSYKGELVEKKTRPRGNEPMYGTTARDYYAIHYWLKKNYGRADHCDNSACEGRSTTFQWAKKRGATYARRRRNFMQLCANCHRRYDSTEETRRKMKEVMRGKSPSLAARRKTSLTLRGHSISQATRDKIGRANSKPIVQLTLKGVEVARFPSVLAAARATNISDSCIGMCATGAYRTCRGYRWKYENSDAIALIKGERE